MILTQKHVPKPGIEVHQQLSSQPTTGLWEPQTTLMSYFTKVKSQTDDVDELKWSRCNTVRSVDLLEEVKKKESFEETQVAPYGEQLFRSGC